MKTAVKTTTFKIQGMYCDGSANTIKVPIDQERGVEIAATSVKHGEAQVLCDLQAPGEVRLTSAIQKSGYRVVGRR